MEKLKVLIYFEGENIIKKAALVVRCVIKWKL